MCCLVSRIAFTLTFNRGKLSDTANSASSTRKTWTYRCPIIIRMLPSSYSSKPSQGNLQCESWGQTPASCLPSLSRTCRRCTMSSPRPTSRSRRVPRSACRRSSCSKRRRSGCSSLKMSRARSKSKNCSRAGSKTSRRSLPSSRHIMKKRQKIHRGMKINCSSQNSCAKLTPSLMVLHPAINLIVEASSAQS